MARITLLVHEELFIINYPSNSNKNNKRRKKFDFKSELKFMSLKSTSMT